MPRPTLVFLPALLLLLSLPPQHPTPATASFLTHALLRRRNRRPAFTSHPLVLALHPSCISATCHARALSAARHALCTSPRLHLSRQEVHAHCPRHAIITLRHARVFRSVKHYLQPLPTITSGQAALIYPGRNRTFHSLARLRIDRVNATAFTASPSGPRIRLRAILRARGCSTARRPVTVYVIDTGCRVSHFQLRGRATALPAPGSRYISGDDDHGHGTHVAARIAGRDFGLAPHVRVVCIKALSHRNEGSSADVLSAIALAGRMHRRTRRWRRDSTALISISLGVAAAPKYTDLDRAVSKAALAGLVSVVAAGNSARDACDFTPARAAGAIAVAATHSDGRLASFSNRGPCVTVGAPGVDVWSAVGGADDMYGVSSGTSMAAPFVSGIAALLLADRGPLQASQVAGALQEMSEWRSGLGVLSTASFCRWMRMERERDDGGDVSSWAAHGRSWS